MNSGCLSSLASSLEQFFWQQARNNKDDPVASVEQFKDHLNFKINSEILFLTRLLLSFPNSLGKLFYVSFVCILNGLLFWQHYPQRGGALHVR